MRFLVVYCHPVDDSFCSAVHRTVLGALEPRHEVRDLDLYARGFDPVLSRQERVDYHSRGRNRRLVEDYLADIRWAEALTFVYPTWWYGLPALLKGWLDRVWIPHETFTLHDSGPPIRPNMHNIRHLSGATAYGAPWWLVKWSGEPGRKTLMRGIRPLCHPRCRTGWQALYKMDSATRADRERFLQRVERAYRRY